jgi:hypothetical protein
MDKYRLRRAILDAAQDTEPAPVSVADLAAWPVLAMAAVEGAAIAESCRGLAEHGYIVNLRPTREPLYRLTAKGRDQIERDAELDEYVWGELAL